MRNGCLGSQELVVPRGTDTTWAGVELESLDLMSFLGSVAASPSSLGDGPSVPKKVQSPAARHGTLDGAIHGISTTDGCRSPHDAACST